MCRNIYSLLLNIGPYTMASVRLILLLIVSTVAVNAVAKKREVNSLVIFWENHRKLKDEFIFLHSETRNRRRFLHVPNPNRA